VRLISSSAPASGTLAHLADGVYTVGIRPHRLGLVAAPGAISLRGTVIVSEITGSESFVHIDIAGKNWVALARGVHHLEPGRALEVYIDPEQLFVFDQLGMLAAAPSVAAAA
jgi:glycerol transport system ATP-binding protein